MRTFSLVIGLCGLLTVTAGRLSADEQRSIETGRKLLKSSANAIVGVTAIAKLQIKASGGGGGSAEREMKIDCSALVIDPSGLLVTSLTNLNPQNALPRMRMQGRGGEGSRSPSSANSAASRCGCPRSEVPARVVLKDEDLDLAFLRPAIR